MEQELLQKSIIVKGLLHKSGVKNDKPWSVLNITDENGDKYSVWITKTDGTKTLAFTQLQTNSWLFNKKVGITYKEEDKTFTNSEGKEINFKARNIVKFNFGKQEEEEKEMIGEKPKEESLTISSDSDEEFTHDPVKNQPKREEEIDISEIPFN